MSADIGFATKKHIMHITDKNTYFVPFVLYAANFKKVRQKGVNLILETCDL